MGMISYTDSQISLCLFGEMVLQVTRCSYGEGPGLGICKHPGAESSESRRSYGAPESEIRNSGSLAEKNICREEYLFEVYEYIYILYQQIILTYACFFLVRN